MSIRLNMGQSYYRTGGPALTRISQRYDSRQGKSGLTPVDCTKNGMGNVLNLFLVKLLHTAIWAFLVTVILYVLYCGLTNQVTIYTWIAIGLVIVEVLVLAVFRGRCPLTLIARNYSNSGQDNFDIFLPNWLARYNKLIFSSLYVIGLMLVGYRLLQRG